MRVIKPPYIGGFCKRKIIVAANIVRCYNKCITNRTHCVKGVFMAAATFSIRMDNSLKKDFADICKSFGMNVSTAINVFAKTVVNQKKIPFEIVSPYGDDFMGSVNILRKEAKKNNKSGMSLAEINKIIKTTRKEKNL